MKKTYEYNGKTYTTIMEIAREVGKARLYQKDFDKYGITVVDNTPTTYTTTATLTTVTTYVTVTATTLTTVAAISAEDKAIAELETNVVDMTRHSFGKALSPFSMDALLKIAKNAGVTNLWETIANVPIRRMRLIMEIKEVYFPTKTAPVKSVTPWQGIPFDKLAKVAQDKGIKWAVDNHPNINRMRLIMALKKNDIQAADIK